jgi:solute:Na+ symporter, SSS family
MSPWMLVIFPLCLATLLGIGWKSRRPWICSNDYLNASRSISLWISALGFLAYNCGSIEVLGMSAMAAQYGVQALHFYWIGGIPGLIFLSLVVLPAYMRTGARSLPEYLGMRFGPAVRLLNAFVSIVGTVCFAAVALYTMAQVLHVILGSGFTAGELVCASVVLAYVLTGGVRASIFASVFQLFVMIAGLVPLLVATEHFTASSWAARSDRWHLWKPLPLVQPHASLDCLGVLVGLGFVISFSYWSTDFVMIQRTLAARSLEEARKVPLLAGFGKMAIAFLIVLPGVAAPQLLGPKFTFDQTMPALMALEFPPALLALGTAALLAGLMAWLAGNVSGFSALWVEEIYRPLRPNRSERHYILVGRISVPVCLALAQAAAYAVFAFRDMMECLQLIVALFYGPLFAVVLVGVFSRRTNERAAFAGILTGIGASLALETAYREGWARFGSQMNANFYAAMLSFAMALGVCLISREKPPAPATARGTALVETLGQTLRPSPELVLLASASLGLCLLLNFVWG